MSTPVRILLVEDSEDDAKLALRALRRGGFEPTSTRVQSAAELDAALAREPWDAVISDFSMPGFTGLEALALVRAGGFDIPFILISGAMGEDTAVAALKAGAHDYMMKQNLARLAPALERELRDARIRADHRRAQHDLVESETRFRALTSLSSDWYWEQDLDYRFTMVSFGADSPFSGDTAQWIGKTPWELHGDDGGLPDWAALREVFAHRQVFRNVEMLPMDLAGGRLYASVSGEPRFDASGLFLGYRGVGRDISARKRAAEKLRESELRFRQMSDSIRSVFFLREAESGRVLYVSPAYEQIWQRSCASLYENPDSWADTVHPDDLASASKSRRAGRTDGIFDSAYRILQPDGAVRWIESRSFPVHDPAGRTVRIAGVAEDVTERKLAQQTLRESDRRFSEMLENVQLASVMLDRDARITYCNEYLLRLSGWQLGEVIGRDWFEVFMPPELGDMRPMFVALLSNQPEAWHVENEIYTRTRERRLVRWNNSVLRSTDGVVIGVSSIGEDITEAKAAELRIAHLNRVYAVLSGINSLIVRARDREELFAESCRIAVEAGHFKMAWIGVVNPEGTLVTPVASAGVQAGLLASLTALFASPAGAITGITMSAEAVREKQPAITNDLKDSARVAFGTQYLAAGINSIAILPLIVRHRPVAVLALYATKAEFFLAEGMKLLGELASDIAFAIDHLEKQEQLDYLAYYDALTGLANRSLFLERLAQYMRSATAGGYKLALYLIDLERFKNINDSLGRPAGDALLRQVAQWLTGSVGDAGLLARIGADHFAVVLPEIRKDSDVTWFLDKSVAAFLEHPFELDGTAFRIAAKGGIAVFPEDGADADTLFKHAEAALKKAKAGGERYLFYTEKMTNSVAGKLTLENQLRQALDREEFVLHYQPKIDVASGKLAGAEALIRWNDPRTGLVPPGRFIPILEETGMIADVGRWALRQAVEDHLRWRAAGLAAVRLAVNVSPLQLRNRDFILEVEQTLRISPHAAAGLELEITESLVMEDVNHSIDSLHALRALGVSIAIDDFGTGFSSLSYLAKLPVDTLKIDRSFIIEMTEGPQGLALVSTIINLAHSLKLKVVAEGVETEEQARLLRLLGCDQIQGFLYSKPLPSALFESKYLLVPLAA